MPDATPSTHAIIAHFADAESLSAALDELSYNRLVDLDEVVSGTGTEFAALMESGKEESDPGTRLVKWLVSLGQESEDLVRLGEAAREGRHGVVINDVREREDIDAISTVLKRHGGADIVYFGDWNTEDLSINR